MTTTEVFRVITIKMQRNNQGPRQLVTGVSATFFEPHGGFPVEHLTDKEILAYIDAEGGEDAIRRTIRANYTADAEFRVSIYNLAVVEANM